MTAPQCSLFCTSDARADSGSDGLQRASPSRPRVAEAITRRWACLHRPTPDAGSCMFGGPAEGASRHPAFQGSDDLRVCHSAENCSGACSVTARTLRDVRVKAQTAIAYHEAGHAVVVVRE